ncbi:glycoside-pentoside-hexuronide (GPH):cation symporter [Niameybacter massiliensis]|uniref:Glycoside-pentoside-hexuronide (GPH):cation symporter n=1 Tax=Holtiella tumoricola TaxID=3018743 RepID=A0AA42DS36_9FIRM|nr:glycoside-pentoside-hexuronide (GPH):cation symporter [Holtiella tumoricola]MDA3734061.1 glycoside-pentoside-hexuronide (GPH):cation symporter [Holtiella tumoricola]
MKYSVEASEKDIYLYSIGNIANTAIFMFVGTYIMFYYTNILGISATVAGTIFMVARLVDAFTDPLMGMIIDKTNSKKFGKYRPYILFGSPLLGVIFVVMFMAPELSMGGKIIYAYTSYILYSLAWTCVQIPQLALPIILSHSTARRAKVQAIFQAVGNIGSLAVTALAIPMLNWFGGDSSEEAWLMVAAIFAVFCTIMFIISAMSVRKLDIYNPAQAKQAQKGEKISFKQRMKVITSNTALLMVLISFGTDSLAIQIGNGLNMYFFKYNMGEKTHLMGIIGWATTIFSFMLIGIVGWYVAKLGKKNGIIVIEAIAIIAALGLLFTPANNTFLVMIFIVATPLIGAVNNMLSRSAVLDSANYAEWKTGINGSALVSSTFTFVNKLSQAFGAFIMGYVLDFVGYAPGLAQQTPQTLNAILYMKTLIPIAAFICSIVAMKFYPISKKTESEMEAFISTKRAKEFEGIETEAEIESVEFEMC